MSTIIKQGRNVNEDHAIRRVAFNFDDMTGRANDYLGDVRRQAAQIIADAEKEAEKIRLRAQEEGRGVAIQAAVKMLRGEVEQQLASLMPALKQAIDQVQTAKQAWLAQWEKNAVHLSAAIAGRIVRRQVERDPEIATDLIRESLELAAGAGQIKLHLNPQDFEALGESVERLTAEFGSLAPTDVVADPKIARGGCRVETQFGVIDQQFESQLARIEEELT